MRFAPGTDPEVIRRAEEAFYSKRKQDQTMQAAPSAQQSLPQPQMPPELQRLQDMSNALGKRIQSDPFMQRYQEQQRQLQSGIQQKTQNYVNSLQQFLNTAPPEFRQFLSSPQTLSRLGMAYQEQLPEMNQVRNIGRQIQQYHQNTYGQEIQKIQQFQMQALPQIQQYQNQMQLFNQQQRQQLRGPQGQTPPTARNEYNYLPEGLTQEEFMKQARVNMTQQYRTPEQMREYFKPLYDSYLQEKATTKQAQPIQLQRQPVQAQPIQAQPLNNAQAAAIKKANEEFKKRTSRPPRVNRPFQQDPIIDPKRSTTTGPRKVTPIIPKPIQPTVDPKRESFKPPKAIKSKGLGNRPKNPNVPSAYQGINTNINRQRQDMR
jgi:hypothetical protein